ncbi:alpha-L-fucosidase [Paraglaciecola aquimarina]|uniref:Alpha-L-fucosidase n=1 Tax=Paraglaciecola aquimarina TaxID=1235557 RepID=A0ABU3STF5_9ALTE|nr:alpha-L-fucosidase [Paraglaciecola aquimarina]MDU0353288.1 alpha-L-fucosidase [Paraglaciecola aquimarina]
MKLLNKLILVVFTAVLQVNVSVANAAAEVKKLSDDERIQWWRDSKFGMFIHWGAYSVIGGERGKQIAKGGAEWAMDKLDYTIEEYEKFPTCSTLNYLTLMNGLPWPKMQG